MKVLHASLCFLLGGYLLYALFIIKQSITKVLHATFCFLLKLLGGYLLYALFIIKQARQLLLVVACYCSLFIHAYSTPLITAFLNVSHLGL